MRNFTIYNILSIAFFISILTSCSIEKRVHQKGFFVKSNSLTTNSYKDKKTNRITANDSKTTETKQFTNLAKNTVIKENSKTSIDYKIDLATDNNKTEDYLISKSKKTENKPNNISKLTIYKSLIDKHKQTLKKGLKISNDRDSDSDNLEFEPLGLASIIIASISLIVFTIPVGSMAYILGLPLAILAILFGIISMVKISRDSDKYKGLVFSIGGVLLAVVSIFVLLAYLT